MISTTYLSDLPTHEAVYALCGGKGRGWHVAYVGIADNLRRRITQHLVTRDSSVTTATAPVSVNPDLITEVRWWSHKDFRRRAYLAAAELVAEGVLLPVLRSRGKTAKEAEQLAATEGFASTMRSLFSGTASGTFQIPTFVDIVQRVDRIERQLAALERRHTKQAD